MRFAHISGAARVLLGVFVGVLAYAYFAPSAYDEREQRVLGFADSVRAIADSLEGVADSLSVEAGKDSVVYVTRYKTIVAKHDSARAVPLPPTCDTSCTRLVAERDSTIETLKVIATHWQDSYKTQLAAYALLKTSNQSLRAANDSLVAVIRDRPKHPKLANVLIGVGGVAIGMGIVKGEFAAIGGGFGAILIGTALQ